MSRRPSLTLTAFLVACVGIGLFAMMDATMKGLALALGAYNALFWRNIVGVGISGAAYGLTRPVRPSTAAMRIHVWRGAIVAVMALLFFYSITVLPLAEAIALSFIAPLIALYLAAILLGETIGRNAIIASLLGIAGVGIILWGRLDGGEHGPRTLWGIAAVLGSAVLYAYSLILARQQAQMAKPGEIAFFQTLTVLVTLAVAAPWFAAIPDVRHVPMMVLASALSVVSLHLLSWAYARAEAQILIPVEYTAFVWAALCGWLAFGEALTGPVIGGAVLIVAGCITAARNRPQPAQVEEIFA